MKKYLAFLSISAMLLTSACSATVGTEGDEDGTSGGDATTTEDGTGSDAGTTGDAGTATDAGSTPTGFMSVVIYDKYTEPDCKKTTSPGPDIDMVAVWRSGKLIGVGKPGSCDYSAGTNPACPDNKHAAAKDIEAACGPFGDIDAVNVSTGYLGLGGGSLELSIGACSSETTDIEKCDGKGDAVAVQSGDEIDVYEVDQWYLGNNDAKKKYITGSCKCIPETYEVWLRTKTGVDTGSVEVGQKTGTGTLTVK
ncbi:MAG: hypothetical protein KC502_12655 [Myxococcales bacterium]|nr:hypothetical protein [Myxococcales bacterium]